MSDHGLLTTVAYKLGKNEPACYALEVSEHFLSPAASLSGLLRSCDVGLSLLPQGSVAIAGAVVRWLKDNLGIVQSSAEIGTYTGASRICVCVCVYISAVSQMRY